MMNLMVEACAHLVTNVTLSHTLEPGWDRGSCGSPVVYSFQLLVCSAQNFVKLLY